MWKYNEKIWADWEKSAQNLYYIFCIYIRRYSQGGAQAEIMCKIGKRVLTKGGRGDIINELSGDGRRGSGGEKPEGKREKVFWKKKEKSAWQAGRNLIEYTSCTGWQRNEKGKADGSRKGSWKKFLTKPIECGKIRRHRSWGRELKSGAGQKRN